MKKFSRKITLSTLALVAMLGFASQSDAQTLAFGVTGTGTSAVNTTAINIGEQFQVNSSISVTSLGVFDVKSQTGGALGASHTVSLFSIPDFGSATGTFLTSVTIPAGVASTSAINSYVYANLTAGALTLLPGKYAVVAYQLNVSGDQYGDTSANNTFNSGGGLISQAPNPTDVYSFTTDNTSTTYPGAQFTASPGTSDLRSASFQFSAIPEPSSYVSAGLLCLSALGLMAHRRLAA